jgi:NADH-quinone oxidoreductase subunit E
MLTEDMKRDLMAELATAETKQSACIEAMQIVQKYHGWISDETLISIADFLDMTPDELDGVATFYNHIYRKPVGKNVIMICDSVTCWILGYENLLAHLKNRLGIGLGETTTDGMFTLVPVQCLGSCEKAPAFMINDVLYTNLDAGRIDEIILQYREK